jgi:hypothetical protein
LRLGIFDENFNEIETVNITPPGAGGGLPSLVKVSNKLYVSYGLGGAFVQELILKD